MVALCDVVGEVLRGLELLASDMIRREVCMCINSKVVRYSII